MKTAAQTMRANPAFSTEQAIQELGTGEALILPRRERQPVGRRARNGYRSCSRMGPVTDDERNGLINHSALYGKYEEEIDRESAFEMLQKGCRSPQSSSRHRRQKVNKTVMMTGYSVD